MEQKESHIIFGSDGKPVSANDMEYCLSHHVKFVFDSDVFYTSMMESEFGVPRVRGCVDKSSYNMLIKSEVDEE